MRLAFCGASGTGKTTLARWFEKAGGIPFNPVGSRTTAKEMGFDSPYDVDKAGKRAEFQLRLQSGKMKWENEHDSFVTDRTSFDELVYTVLHDVKAVDERFLDRVLSHMQRYTHIVYCPVSVFCNVSDDLIRVQDATYQRVFDLTLVGALATWSPKSLLVLDEKGVEERIARVVSYLNE